MPIFRKLGTKEVALTACFAALYVVLSFLPIFQLIGFSKYITVATILAPIIGIVLGPYLGTVSTLLGGIISSFFSPFFAIFSLAGGVVGALCGALLFQGKRTYCTIIYLAFLLVFGFYPSVGPAWVFPPYMWFQIAGFLILISPLQSLASRSFKSCSNTRLLFAFFITSLTSTMAGQIAGTLVYEMITVTSDWHGFWIALTAVYPLERTTIALVAAFIGAPLYKVLKSTNLIGCRSITQKVNGPVPDNMLSRGCEHVCAVESESGGHKLKKAHLDVPEVESANFRRAKVIIAAALQL